MKEKKLSQVREKMKDVQIGKEEVELSLFLDYIILSIESSKDAT